MVTAGQALEGEATILPDSITEQILDIYRPEYRFVTQVAFKEYSLEAQEWVDGNQTLDPFGAGVGHFNPYPVRNDGPPSDGDCQTICECDPGETGDEPPSWECEGEYDEESDPDSEIGSISDNTCYTENGLRADCNEDGDVRVLRDRNTGKTYLGVYNESRNGFSVADTFVPANIDGIPDSYGMTWMRLNPETGLPDENGEYYEIATTYMGTEGWGGDSDFRTATNFGAVQQARDIPDDARLKSLMMELVAKCKTFLDGYLGALDKKFGAAHRNTSGEFDMAANFDRIGLKLVDDGSGKLFKGASGNAKGLAYMHDGKRVIAYRSFSTEIAYAAVTLSELLHHSRESSWYGDDELDIAMEAFVGKEAYNIEKERMKKDHRGNPGLGMVAHSLVNKNCQ